MKVYLSFVILMEMISTCGFRFLKCSTTSAKLLVVVVTRGALLVVGDGGRDNTPKSPFAPKLSKT